jgi:hypothetical protein
MKSYFQERARMKALFHFSLFALFLSAIAAQAAEPSLQAQPGRYQIVMNPVANSDTFLLDTWTGNVWQRIKYPDMVGEPSVWESVDRLDGTKTFVEWRKKHASKAEAAQIDTLK